MATQRNLMAPSPRQILNGQGVLRISARKNSEIKSNTVKTDCTKTLKIGTWNVKSMYMTGKLHNIRQEMDRLGINILGISETRWPNSGQIKTGDATLFYSGNDSRNHENGVGILLDSKTSLSVLNFIPISDRAMMVQLKATPMNVNIIQVYAPTADKPEAEIKAWYSQIKQLLSYTRKTEITFVLGDFNAKVGRGRSEDVVGEYGIGNRNERGDTLVQFCQEENFFICNTWYKLPARRLYTWKSPQDSPRNPIRNQIDYILAPKRYRNGVLSAKTYPGADVGSDHNPVVARMRIRLKRIGKSFTKKPNMDALRNESQKQDISDQLNAQLRSIKQRNTSPTPGTENSKNIEDTWKQLKNAMQKVQEQLITKDNKKQHKSWMTQEILDLMESRRSFKSTNAQKYKATDKLIRNKIKEAKEMWMMERCREVEELYQKHDLFNLHKKVKQITGKHKPQTLTKIVDDENKPILSKQRLEEVWTKYIGELFDDDDRSFDPKIETDQGPDIMISEVEKAIKNLKCGKAAGPDNIYPDLLKLIDEDNLKTLTQLFNSIYKTGNIPKDWLKSTFIPIPKKSSAKRCDEFRLISLMSQVLKLFLKVLHNRIRRKCEQDMSDQQMGFRDGLGTREALFALSVLLQKCRDQRKEVHLCFIDYTKAFDCVNHKKLLDILERRGIDSQDLRIIHQLYEQQIASVKLQETQTTEIPIKRGVRQGCVLSPMLFNMYSESIFQNALEDAEDGIKVNGRLVNNLRYADDTIMIADSCEGLQRLLDRLSTVGDSMGLKINTTKTKVMVINRNPGQLTDVVVYGTPIARVSKFRYLGSWISEDLNPDVEIRARIEMARANFLKMRNLLCDKRLNIHIRYRFVKCYVHSTLLYGAEAWTLKINTMNRLEAFELWIYRRMMKIPWTDYVSNLQVLHRMNKERELLDTIKRRKTAYLGHLMRHNKYEFLQLIMEGKIEGKRGPGRRQCSWLKNIRDWTGLDSHTLLRKARDREEFAIIVADLH